MQNRWRTGRSIPALRAGTMALMGAGLLGNAASPPHDVRVTVTDLRTEDGQVLACLTASPKGFPDCSKDPAARKLAIPAAKTVVFSFKGVDEGTYAISLLHDENGNGRADKTLMIPKEGFGFSRDAKVRMGPPSFEDAAFRVGDEKVHQRIRMRYLFR
ncbi:MAG: DUF2141 domain-containing protein [Sphingomonadaceae bacterium]|nr:MAG: DUF2141 domain-containing protein [Sphingomonadaceae bacterium]